MLVWLKHNNTMYKDIAISEEQLQALPEDDMPIEIYAVIQQEMNDNLVMREYAGYVPSDIFHPESECHTFVFVCEKRSRNHKLNLDVDDTASNIVESDYTRERAGKFHIQRKN